MGMNSNEKMVTKTAHDEISDNIVSMANAINNMAGMLLELEDKVLPFMTPGYREAVDEVRAIEAPIDEPNLSPIAHQIYIKKEEILVLSRRLSLMIEEMQN